MNLDFATFFTASIKPFMHVSQKKAVCILLTGKPDGYSDAACSNYILGKRAINDDCRIAISEITEEEMKSRLDAMEIFDPQPTADALRVLVEHVSIPKSTLNRLNRVYKNSTPTAYITQVFRASSTAKDARQLTDEEKVILASFSSPLPPSSEREPEEEPDPAVLTREDVEWLRNYIPLKMEIKSASFFGTPVMMNRVDLSMPDDYPALVLLLKHALNGMPIATFTFEEFLERTGINSSGRVKGAKLACLKFVGQVDGIDSCIRGQNLRDVSDIVMLMRGRVTLDEEAQIVKAFKYASNPNVRYIRALNFDSRLAEMEVTLIVRYDSTAAYQEINGPGDDSDMKIFKRPGSN